MLCNVFSSFLHKYLVLPRKISLCERYWNTPLACSAELSTLFLMTSYLSWILLTAVLLVSTTRVELQLLTCLTAKDLSGWIVPGSDHEGKQPKRIPSLRISVKLKYAALSTFWTSGLYLYKLAEFGWIWKQLPIKGFSDFNVFGFWQDLRWSFLLWTRPPNVDFYTDFSVLVSKEAYLFHWVVKIKNVKHRDTNQYSANENLQ